MIVKSAVKGKGSLNDAHWAGTGVSFLLGLGDPTREHAWLG